MFEPDIVVTSSEANAPVLVVEAKRHLRNAADAERQLKRYMVESGCPTGLLVTPERLRIYRDRFRGGGEDSIELVGEFDIADTLGRSWGETTVPAEIAEREVAFERAVQAWLEELPETTDELPPQLQDAIDEYVLPVLAEGEVRAARPRWRSRPASVQ